MKSLPTQAVHVVILGGGFGGRDAAIGLARRLRGSSRVTLVDRNDYTLYTPMLTEVAGRSVSPKHIQASTRDLSPRIRLVQDTIEAVDLPAKTVQLASGITLTADHLLIALGSTTNYHDVPGAEQHSFTMKTLEDARRVRTLAERNVDLAATETDGERRKQLLTFIVAGGGYTGVETIAALNDLVSDSVRAHGIPRRELTVMLIEPAPRLMAEMPESLAAYGQQRLEMDGIQVKTGVGVKSVEAGSILLTNGETLPSGMLIWDTGIRPNPLVDSFDCPKGKKGGIAVDSTFRVVDRKGVWAIGDCAEIPKPYEIGAFFEPTAQNATREGAHVAGNILAAIQGRPLRPFAYKQIGELAVISRRRGVAHVFGFKVLGVAAWLMWRGIYIAKMPSMRQRLGLLWDYARLAFGRKYVSTEWRLSPPRVQPRLQAETN